MTDLIVHVAHPLTLVGGADIDEHTLNICLNTAPITVAADGGAGKLLQMGREPLAVIGDGDSLSAAARDAFATKIHMIPEQDTTDFEKALSRVSATFILAAGFLGGRFDHSLAALNTVHRLGRTDVILVADDEIVLPLRGEVELTLEPGLPLALIAMTGTVVTTSGLAWDLQARTIAPGGTLSTSNAVADGPVQVRSEGLAFLILPLRALPAATAVAHAG